MGGFLGKIFSSGATELVKAGTGLIDEIFTTQEEKLEAKKELFKLAMEDKSRARRMYALDSNLQKVFAIFFLFAWVGLTILILNYFVFEVLDLKDWQIAFVSTIYGSISTKLGTIVDFLFGGSSTTHNPHLKD